MGKPSIDIGALSREERLELLERIWESLSPTDVPVTGAQRAELDRRAEKLDQDVTQQRALGVPWDEVTRQLRARR